MAVKHYLLPLSFSMLLLYLYRSDDSDPGPLTCENQNKNQTQLNFNGKVVIVTGANRGIGYEVALELARRGARLVMGCRNPWSARAARDKIVSITNNTRISIIGLDMSSMRHISTFVMNFKDKFDFDHVDVIINNAAAIPQDDLRHVTNEDLEMIMATNFLGPVHLTKSLLPLLSKDGVVINMIDNVSKTLEIDLNNINSDRSYNSDNIHSLSKYYLQLITQEMASRFQHFGISVYNVYPCKVLTSLHSAFPHQLSQWILWILSPVLGTGQLREAARTVVWLAGGGAVAGTRESGSTWHSCEKVKHVPESAENLQKLWTRSEHLINKALNFKK